MDFEKQGWVNRLRKNIESKHNTKYLVYNFSISGDTTEGLLKRFKYECGCVEEIDTIIFAIGSNDSSYLKSKKDNWVIFPEFEENLIKLINLAKKFTKKIIFVGLIPVDEDKTNPLPWAENHYCKNENVMKYDFKIKEICEKDGLKYIYMFDKVDKNDLEDGVHPNNEGHKKIFEVVKDNLILE